MALRCQPNNVRRGGKQPSPEKDAGGKKKENTTDGRGIEKSREIEGRPVSEGLSDSKKSREVITVERTKDNQKCRGRSQLEKRY